MSPPTVSIAVDLPSVPPAKARPQEVWEPPGVEALGRVLPGYEVLALVGGGSLGAVYRARQKSLGRLVALKLLSPELAQRAPEFTERFNQEAGALAKLSHPAIVHLFDSGHTSDGQLYIAMEFVEGRDVSERLAGKEPLPPQEALRITLDVCAALEHAHQRGVIHRDIKPANIMLDAAGRVKITDFGLAHILQRALPHGRRTTTLLGTPRFTAPEALDAGTEVDGRADVFSAGVMLYQMLTGEVPRGAAPPPSQCQPGIDTRFDAIVACAMAEHPVERYQSAAELREALEELQRVPDPSSLPAATGLQTKASPARRSRTRREEAAAAKAQSRSRASGHQPEPPPRRRIELTPWFTWLGLLTIAGLWFWQQKHHSDEELYARRHTHVTEVPSPSPPPPPAPTVPAVNEAPPPAMSTAIPIPAAPTTLPVTEDLSEAQRRIAQIQGDFNASIQAWQADQDAKFAQLQAQYLRAVKNGIVSMRNARRLDDLAGLEEEERLLLSKTPLPPVEAARQPERARLRGIYDGQVQQIARAGAEVKVEIYNRLLGSFFAYQSILKQTNKTSSAALVAGLMEDAVKERDALRATLGPPP